MSRNFGHLKTKIESYSKDSGVVEEEIKGSLKCMENLGVVTRPQMML